MQKVLLFILVIVSCTTKNKPAAIKANLSTNQLAMPFSIAGSLRGDSLFANQAFLKTINTTCKLKSTFVNRTAEQIEKDKQQCALSTIKFDYKNLVTNIANPTIIFEQGNITVYLISKKQKLGDVLLQMQLNKSNSTSQTLSIYSEEHVDEALIVKVKYYYIKKDTIYIASLIEDESGTSFDKLEKYNINLEKAIFEKLQ